MAGFKKQLIRDSLDKFGEADIGRWLRYLLDVDGYTHKTIAERYGVSEDAVFYHIRERGAYERTKVELHTRLIKQLGYVDSVDYFVRGELNGRSLESMARELGILRKEVVAWRKKVIAKSKQEEPHRWLQQRPG